MHYKTVAAVIAATYSALVALWLATLPAARHAFSRQPQLAPLQPMPQSVSRGSHLCTSAGVLLVFLANIVTMGLFLGSVASPTLAARLPRLRFPVPRILSLAGACLFVAGGIWGTLVLIFNPGYRPFFLKPKSSARIATHGPYALVRHPRYAVEASLNVILAAFTGAWLPLLGILGWPALRKQADLEDAYLLRAAPVAAREYLDGTGAFVPRFARGRRRGLL